MTELRELGQRRQERLEGQQELLEEEEGQERQRTAADQPPQPEPAAANTSADDGISWGMGEAGDGGGRRSTGRQANCGDWKRFRCDSRLL